GLGGLAERGSGPGVVRGSVSSGGVAVVFSGQGAQRPGMGEQLRRWPVFAQAFDEVVDAFGPELRQVIADGDGLDQTGGTQPALFAFEVAVWRLLQWWGVDVPVVAGHSIGELAAAYVAGVWSLPDAV